MTNPEETGATEGGEPEDRKRSIDELEEPGDDDEEEEAALDEAKLQARREANRIHAFKSRQRSKMLLQELQTTVETLNKEKGEIERQNAVLRAQVEVLQQQNTSLMQNQQMMMARVGGAVQGQMTGGGSTNFYQMGNPTQQGGGGGSTVSSSNSGQQQPQSSSQQQPQHNQQQQQYQSFQNFFQQQQAQHQQQQSHSNPNLFAGSGLVFPQNFQQPQASNNGHYDQSGNSAQDQLQAMMLNISQQQLAQLQQQAQNFLAENSSQDEHDQDHAGV